MTRDEALQELGVEPGVPAQTIRAAYLALLRQRKPDQDPVGFRRLREAYELLRAPPVVEVASPPSSALVDEKSELRRFLEHDNADALNPVSRIKVIDALLVRRPDDFELFSWLIQEMFFAGLTREAIVEAHRFFNGPRAWTVEAAPVWLVAIELFPQTLVELWWRASGIESAPLRMAIAEMYLCSGMISESTLVMTRLLEQPAEQIKPLITRVLDVLMVFVVVNMKRAAPLVQTALLISGPETGAILIEVCQNEKARWLPNAVQFSLPDHLRLRQLPANALSKLPAEVGQRAPRLLARIQSMVVLPSAPRPNRETSEERIIKMLGIAAFIFVTLSMIYALVTGFLARRGHH